MEQALLDRPAQVVDTPRSAGFRWTPLRALACAGALVYGGGMLSAMLWSAWTGGAWSILLLALPQCLVAVGCGAGAMAGALLAPDPYVSEPGHPPGKLPDFN